MKDVPVGAAAMPVPAARRSSGMVGDYIALTKPRLNFLVVATSAAGYYLGSRSPPRLSRAGRLDNRTRR